MSSAIKDLLAIEPDMRLTIWAHIEGISSKLVQLDGPSDPGDYLDVRRVLDAGPLTTTQGVNSLLDVAPISDRITLKITDSSGWFRQLLTETEITRLAAPVAEDDTSIKVEDASSLAASGVVYIGRERIEYTGITAGGSYDTLTGCSRATYSEGYNHSWPLTPEGILPVYPVMSTPGHLEGRYIILVAMPMSAAGEMLYEEGEALEIYRGIIDSVPLSVDGAHWSLQCSGLGSLLNQTVRNDNAGRALLVQPIWEPGKGLMILLQPSSILRIKVVRRAYAYVGGTGNVEEEEERATTDWITVELGSGGIAYAGEYSTDLAGVGAAIAAAIYEYDNDIWAEFQDTVMRLTLGTDGRARLYMKSLTGWQETEPRLFGYSLSVDYSTLSCYRRGIQEQLRLQSSTLGGAGQRLIWGNSYDDEVATEYYYHYGVVISDDWKMFISEHDPDLRSITLLEGTDPALSVHVGPQRDKIAVYFPDGPAWDSAGYCEGGGEALEIISIEALPWGLQTGTPAYELTVKREPSYASPFTVARSTDNSADPEELTPTIYIIGESALRCAAGLLMGRHSQGSNGNMPWEDDIGSGLYAAHFDLPEFERLISEVSITGGRRARYSDELRLQDWIAQNLALEGLCIAPKWKGTSYKLAPIRLSVAPAKVHTIEVDWRGAVTVLSGLGRVTNIIRVEESAGDGKYQDLDSQVRYGVSRPQAYKLAHISSVDGLTNLSAATGRLFSLYGSPTVSLVIAASAVTRVIEVGDGVTFSSPNLPARYLVLSCRRTWIANREHCSLTLQAIPALSTVAYAPSALVSSAAGRVATVEGYSEGTNPWSGEASAPADYFEIGDEVVLFTPEDQAAAEVDDTIADIDTEAGSITLTDNDPSAGQIITHKTRAGAVGTSATRYAYEDGKEDWI